MLELFPPLWNGTLREHYLLLFGVAGSIALVAGITGAWVGSWLAGHRLRRDLLDTLRDAASVRAQSVDALANAVDVVSVEIERLSEAQRYTAKLLAERVDAAIPSPRREPQSITPH